jgi:hypothetical protein
MMNQARMMTTTRTTYFKVHNPFSPLAGSARAAVTGDFERAGGGCTASSGRGDRTPALIKAASAFAC